MPGWPERCAVGAAERRTPYMSCSPRPVLSAGGPDAGLRGGHPGRRPGPLEWRVVIGCFVNTVALRLDLSGSPTFETLLSRLKRLHESKYILVTDLAIFLKFSNISLSPAWTRFAIPRIG